LLQLVELTNSFFLLTNRFFVFEILVPASMLGYQPCAPSNEWYFSQPTIRCSQSFAATGFAPDPKDCSKYYACDSYIGNDGLSTGILMQCLAGLWWDQQRRSCVLPSEVACNPYNIINSQGQSGFNENNVNGRLFFLFLLKQCRNIILLL